ncbi:MAG: DNA-binding response regulator [Desulfobacteraceae bacterium 4572_88]|nr:MAG: DNA-binding response regulator [Desulfobacteraceae bacterium 4572_88]
MKNSEKKRILIIEDEAHIAEGVKLNLSLRGYEVIIAADGRSGLQQWKEWSPDLIVLDIMLPVLDGLSVLRHIRLEDEQMPILVLSAKGTDGDKIKGLKYGVDDYMAKPFNLDEFLLRIERLITRASWIDKKTASPGRKLASIPQQYVFGCNRIDFNTSAAHCKSGDIRLTDQEIKLLKLFIVNRGKPLSRHKLLEIGWGYSGKTTTRTVDNFIVRFRKYFEENPKKPVFFKSLRSVGYVFEHD